MKNSDARPKSPLPKQVHGHANEASLKGEATETNVSCHPRRPLPVRRATRDLHVGFAGDDRDVEKDEASHGNHDFDSHAHPAPEENNNSLTFEPSGELLFFFSRRKVV